MSVVDARILAAIDTYFADPVFSTRVDHDAQLDGFTSSAQLSQYLTDTNAAVQADIAQLNAAPVIVRHPSKKQPEKRY